MPTGFGRLTLRRRPCLPRGGSPVLARRVPVHSFMFAVATTGLRVLPLCSLPPGAGAQVWLHQCCCLSRAVTMSCVSLDCPFSCAETMEQNNAADMLPFSLCGTRAGRCHCRPGCQAAAFRADLAAEDEERRCATSHYHSPAVWCAPGRATARRGQAAGLCLGIFRLPATCLLPFWRALRCYADYHCGGPSPCRWRNCRRMHMVSATLRL